MIDYQYNSQSGVLFDFEEDVVTGPVTCLGKTFASDKERKAYYLDLLREKLKDPDFRNQEGFPIGTDDDILALSNPPYQCACPNPWAIELIEDWENEKVENGIDTLNSKEPFAADVSEGKNDPIYNIHTYHTKVPPKAIVRYLMHYTNPGDIVLDGFCGSGMTGIAAQLCGDNDILDKLYSKDELNKLSIGPRHAILNDLSPLAYLISSGLNTPLSPYSLNSKCKAILDKVKNDVGWMYETKDPEGNIGEINYTVWSDVFICPNCGHEIIFYDAAMNKTNGKVADSFLCPHCQMKLKKKDLDRSYTSSYNLELGETIKTIKTVPVLINYTIGNRRFEKKPDLHDLDVISRIDKLVIPYNFPVNRMIEGKETRRNDILGYTNVNLFYTKRTLYILSSILDKIDNIQSELWFTSQLINLSKLNRYRPEVSFPFNPLSGTMYIGSLVSEANVFNAYEGKLNRLLKLPKLLNNNIVSLQSTTELGLKDNCIDYIFIDPPFGANLSYSELSFLYEAWISLVTNNKEEAIENSVQHKGIYEYKSLMTACFKELYRVLKSGHWMTVEFSNTDRKVWNSLQQSLAEAGFIVANVSALDKQQGSFKAVTTSTAVKQDLVITVYKPDSFYETKVKGFRGEESVWNFVHKHLEYLPIVKTVGKINKHYEVVPERDPRIIFDKVITYYVANDILLPISSPEFLQSISKHFAERDGLVYLPEQASIYDKYKADGKIGSVDMTKDLFVHDETSAISWIREQLKNKPMTLGELTPLFLQELNSWDKNEKKLELGLLLEENFLRYDGVGGVPAQIHSYLSTNYKELRNLDKDNVDLCLKAKGRWYVPDTNKRSDLDKVREKSLLKDFNSYLTSKGKLKEFRIEALRAGFKKAWQEKNYKLIVDFAMRIPASVLEEDSQLLMWYSGALTRVS